MRDQFGLPTARKYKLPKNKRGTGKVRARSQGRDLTDQGSTYVVVLTQADLIAPSEVSYYCKRVGDISRRWLYKGHKNRVSVRLVTLFANLKLDDFGGVDGITVGPRYEQFNLDDDTPDVGMEWEFRNVYGEAPVATLDKARSNTRKLLKQAASRTGWQDNDLDFLGTFIMAIEVHKWKLG